MNRSALILRRRRWSQGRAR